RRSDFFVFFFQAEDGIRDKLVTGVQTCALPICRVPGLAAVVVVTATASTCRSRTRSTPRPRRRSATSGRAAHPRARPASATPTEIGRASCRERVEMAGGGVWVYEVEHSKVEGKA